MATLEMASGPLWSLWSPPTTRKPAESYQQPLSSIYLDISPELHCPGAHKGPSTELLITCYAADAKLANTTNALTMACTAPHILCTTNHTFCHDYQLISLTTANQFLAWNAAECTTLSHNKMMATEKTPLYTATPQNYYKRNKN